MVLGIGTPPNKETSVLTDLRDAHLANPDDDTLAFVEISAGGFEHHPVDCGHCLELANPQLDDLLSRREAVSMLKWGEGEYRRKRLCQIVVTNESPFLTAEEYDPLARDWGVPDGSEVVLAVDASLKDDSTAIVIGTVEPNPHFDKLAVWEKPKDYDGWRVPILAVEDCIRRAAQRWTIREVTYDRAYFTHSAQVLAGEGFNMVEFPQQLTRQTPATHDLKAGALEGRWTHSGDSDLRRHVLAATVHESDKGIRLAKTSRSKHAPKVDLATALTMCHARCVHYASQRKKRRRVIGV